MTSGWGLLCSNGCSQPDVLQGIESDTTTSCQAAAVAHPAKFCVNAPSGKASCNVSGILVNNGTIALAKQTEILYSAALKGEP